MTKIKNCKNCGSHILSWHCGTQNNSGVVDGRLRMHEIGVIFYLGCDECSETLSIINGDKVAEIMTRQMAGQ